MPLSECSKQRVRCRNFKPNIYFGGSLVKESVSPPWYHSFFPFGKNRFKVDYQSLKVVSSRNQATQMEAVSPFEQTLV